MKKFQFLKAGDYMKTITRAKYLDRIIELNGTPDIKIITGIRRSGKSKLMQAYIAYLKSNFENINIIFIDFMDLAYEEIKEYHALHAYVEEHYQEGKTNYLFVDEVQMCPKFELAINSLYSKGKYDIYVTGSNAFLLSADLATLFTGRYIEIHVFPFSFQEYCQYYDDISDKDKLFDEYAIKGGLAGSYAYRTEKDRTNYIKEVNDLEARKEEENTTAALLRGECAAFTQRGAKLAGLDVYVSSNVPKGSGVSSSAAFEVLIGVILNDCFMTEKVSPIAIAQIGQWAENVYFGKPCGLMDQMASSVGNIITIDFASPAKPVVEPVAVDFSKAGLALCILDSGADHADLTDEYAAIPAECRAVAAVCGGEVLRDVPFETFLAKLPECRRQCGDRAVLRAFHVYADNDRVAKQVAALHDGDFDTFLCLVNESGRSSWEYLQNVIPAGYKEHQEVGVTIAAAKHLLGDKGAVRVHGGGFAGTVQAFVPVEMLDEFKAGMEAILGEGRCHVLSIRPEGGAVL